MTKGEKDMVGILCWVAREEERSGGSSSTKDKWQQKKEQNFGGEGKGIYYYQFTLVSLFYKTAGSH